MSLAEKLDVARQLARLGVDVIEAGFPAASPGDAEAVRAIAEALGGAAGPVVCALARATERDIEVCAASLAPAPRRRLHTFLATSDIHLAHKLRISRAEAVHRARTAVALARTFVDDVEFSPEDATRSDPEFLCEVLATVIDAGATTLNIPDTVGYTTPSEYEALIRRVCALAERAPHAVVVSTHCHDDLGLAVANSLAGVRAGARQVECTINGIGERAGNASLEEIVMALRTRADVFGVDTAIATEELTRASRLVTACTGAYVAPNKAVVGGEAAGPPARVHHHRRVKHRATYEIMSPESVGADGSTLVLGKHSGRNALRRRMEAMGIQLDDERFEELFARFKELADRKKVVDARDLTALATAAHEHAPSGWSLLQLQIASGTHLIPTATVRMRAPDGATHVASGTGSGPIDATCRAVNAVVGDVGELAGFTVRGVTEGIAAAGEVTVRVKDVHTGDTHLGYGVHTDVVTASAEAYVDAMNRLFQGRDAQATREEEAGLRRGDALVGVTA
jgi:2-isopropylmalate synthase